MGMTIEDIKNEIRSDLTAKIITGDDYSESLRNSIAQLLVIAEKYRKIEQILDDWINEDSVGMSDYWMGRIKEVLDDGNN